MANIKNAPKRVKDALKKISCSGVYNWYETRDFVELVVDKWGDTCTYRIYDNGEITER